MKGLQQNVELNGVFQCELSSDKAFEDDVGSRWRLQAGKTRTTFRKARHIFAQLAGMWTVFGIVDDDEFGVLLAQGMVGRARFGSRRNVRGNDDTQVTGQDLRVQCLMGLRIVSFQDEKDLQR